MHTLAISNVGRFRFAIFFLVVLSDDDNIYELGSWVIYIWFAAKANISNIYAEMNRPALMAPRKWVRLDLALTRSAERSDIGLCNNWWPRVGDFLHFDYGKLMHKWLCINTYIYRIVEKTVAKMEPNLDMCGNYQIRHIVRKYCAFWGLTKHEIVFF